MSENMTNRDILLRVLDKTDALVSDVSEIKGSLAPTVTAVADHELRIRALEKFKNAVPATSALALVVAVVGFFFH